MIAFIDWLPVWFLALGFLTGAASMMLFTEPTLRRLINEARVWRHRHSRLLENYRLQEQMATDQARLILLLRDKLAEGERWNLGDDDSGEAWKRADD